VGAVAQTGQRRLGQGVEGSATIQAFIAMKSMRCPMSMDMATIAMRTFNITRELLLNELLNFVPITPTLEGFDQFLRLR
jgi:hypothetical protein